LVAAGKWKMEKLAPEAGTAAGNRPENLGGKWRRYRCWGIAGNGEGDFREGENVEGENVGGKCLLAL
jgi:hypothetical protein